MQPWIRRYNYIQDWYHTQNEIYAKHNTGAYPVTYYHVDLPNSIYDEKLMAGSYEHYGVGELSGIKWIKIRHLPVYFAGTIQPMSMADESGVSLGESMHSELTIPSEYGFHPSPWDFIHFSQDFMFKRNTDDVPIFVVKNVDPSTWGDLNYFRISIKPATDGMVTQLDKQIIKDTMFVEFTKQIHEMTIANALLSLQVRHEKLAKKIEKKFHTVGAYFNEEVF